MDASSVEALMLDPEKCSKLSMEQKRDLVREMSKWSDGVIEMLHSWSRQEVLQILCMELGKERKYTSLAKSELIERLLKIVEEKKSREQETANVSEVQPSSENGETTPKRQRKLEEPHRLPFAAFSSPDLDSENSTYCKNSACKANLNREDVFCKRCSCCICRKYDDNKDPSLWLICNSEPPFCGPSCSMSCHLECAVRHENSGILKDRQDKGLDGSFCCVSCGKVNDLLSSWRKQLVVARDTRRVDEMCYRLSLGQKILTGTKHYQNLYGIVDEAVKCLEQDVGPLTGQRVKNARGIVNRLSSGQEVQRLCASAVESLDLILSSRVLDTPSDCSAIAGKLVRFEDICASFVRVILNFDDSNFGNVVGYSLWHRKADDIQYPKEPTCRLFTPNTKFLLSGLDPATRYFLKVVTFDTDRDTSFCELQFRTGCNQDELLNLNAEPLEVESSQSPATNCSSLSNPLSFEDETNNVIPGDNYLAFSGTGDKTSSANLLAATMNCLDQGQTNISRDLISLSDEENSMRTRNDTLLVGINKEASNSRMVEEASKGKVSKVPLPPKSQTGLPNMPCKSENLKDSTIIRNIKPKLNGKDIIILRKDDDPQAGSSSKKRNGERREECTGIGDKDFEYYVKVIRQLECDGHIETSFRQKFLTWYSLRATSQEIRIVKVFIDTFVEDPESLAQQLVDTFSDIASIKRCCTVPAGFCTKLWH